MAALDSLDSVRICYTNMLLFVGASRSVLLRARTEVSETQSNKHGCVDQFSNQHLVRLLRCRHRRRDDRW